VNALRPVLVEDRERRSRALPLLANHRSLFARSRIRDPRILDGVDACHQTAYRHAPRPLQNARPVRRTGERGHEGCARDPLFPSELLA
jgi:hypothetical protein